MSTFTPAELDAWRPLVFAAARRMPTLSTHDREDWQQIAWIAVIKALNSFDPARGPLSAWCSLLVKQALSLELSRAASRPERTYEDMPEPGVTDSHDAADAADWVRTLRSRRGKRKVLSAARWKLALRWAKLGSLAEVAREQGTSTQNIQQKLERILSRLRKENHGYAKV